jgi:hypothetical protein
MSAGQRFRTVKVGTEWMPAKSERRTTRIRKENGVETTELEYYDDESLKDLFGDGLTGKERKEALMEETQGVGTATPEDIQKYPELVYEHYLNNDKDEVPDGDDD